MTAVRALALLALLPAAAAAQGTSALRNHDPDAPVALDAGTCELRDREKLALCSGGVTVTQGRLTLDSARMRVRYQQVGGGDPTILRVDAQDGVRLTSPSERAQARYGIYDVEERLVTLVGDVVLNQGGSVLRGQRLAINLATGRSTLDGGGAPAAPGTAPAPGGRVTGRFVVPERKGT